MGLEPLYDLPGKEKIFKYIVSQKQDFDKYTTHNRDLVTYAEFEHLMAYTQWMRYLGGQ